MKVNKEILHNSKFGMEAGISTYLSEKPILHIELYNNYGRCLIRDTEYTLDPNSGKITFLRDFIVQECPLIAHYTSAEVLKELEDIHEELLLAGHINEDTVLYTFI